MEKDHTQNEGDSVHSTIDRIGLKTLTNNEKVNWTLLREITVNANNFDRIEFEYNFEDEPKTIIVLRSSTRRASRISHELIIKQAYEGELAISYNKYKDLLSLCKSGVIPAKYHIFYDNLKCHTVSEGNMDEED